MATVYSIDHVGGTEADVSVAKLSETSFRDKGTEVLPNGARRTTATIAEGDDIHRATVVSQTIDNPKGLGGKGQRSFTLSFNTWARVTVDDVLSDIQPVSLMLAVNLPSSVSVEIADVRQALENLYGLTYTTLTVKEPDNERLSAACLFGVSDIF